MAKSAKGESRKMGDHITAILRFPNHPGEVVISSQSRRKKEKDVS